MANPDEYFHCRKCGDSTFKRKPCSGGQGCRANKTTLEDKVAELESRLRQLETRDNNFTPRSR